VVSAVDGDEEVFVTGHLAIVVRQLLGQLDAGNFDALPAFFTSDAQAVEEIRREWMRSSADIEQYFGQLAASVSDVTSHMNDVHEVSWAETGLVTFWLEQDYVLNEQSQHVSAPTTVVLRRDQADWKVALIHSASLPPDAS
jgi:hypothetical protein